jgi:hypothetical protein
VDSASRFSRRRVLFLLLLSVFYHDYDYYYYWLSPSIWVSRSVERDRAIVRVFF